MYRLPQKTLVVFRRSRVGRTTVSHGSRGSRYANEERWGIPSYQTYVVPATAAVQAYTQAQQAKHIRPRNGVQDRYVKLMQDPGTSIVVSTGPAGTGKSCLAVATAVDMLQKGHYQRIVISRPAVSVEEEHGFLPGSINEKMDPWMRPLFDTFYKYYTPDNVAKMIANKSIDICPLAYLRGRTFENSFIIIDEAQNCSVKQMLMVMTRIGKDSKMVITGDPMQHDRGVETSGLVDLIGRLEYDAGLDHHHHHDENDAGATDEDGIQLVEFGREHIVRHPVIKQVLRLYDDADFGRM